MGYFYKAEPEAAPRAISWAMPKTHTPASPVKERGHRYYNPAVGRWLSRDPIEEGGGININAFSGNNSICGSDSLGLSACCCCCAERLVPEVLGPYIVFGDLNYLGNIVRFDVTLKYVPNDKIWGDCHFTWSEWSDHDTGTVTGDKKWHDITGASVDEGCTTSWGTRSKKCGSSDNFKFNDTPHVQWGSDAPDAPHPPFRWEHKIKVEIYSTENCPSCRCKKIVAEVDRYTIWRGGTRASIRTGTMISCVN